MMDESVDHARPYHHGDLRNALMQAALSLLVTEGLEGLRLREVARRTGVSHSAPYRHFANKAALLAAIAEEGFEQLAEALAAVIEMFPNDPREQLRAVHAAYIRFALDNPARLRVMFSGLISGATMGQERPQTLWAAEEKVIALLVGIMQAGHRTGVLIGDDPLRLTMAAWTMMHGFAVGLIEYQVAPRDLGAASPEQAAEALADLLYGGIGRKPAK